MTILALTLALIVIVYLALYLAAIQAVRRAEAEFPPVGDFVSVEGTRLHYVCQGSGQPVVLLHGNPGFIEDFSLGVLDSLARQYRVCAFDRPGHGYSSRSQGEVTPVVQARLLRGALQQLGIEKPILVGYSWSGSVVLAYTLKYPEELTGIVLLGALAFRRKRTNPLLEQISEIPILGDLLRGILPIVLGKNLVEDNLVKAFAPDSVATNYRKMAQALWTRPSQTGAVTQDNVTVNPTLATLSPRYGEIRVPVAIVTGDNDQIVDAQENSRALSRAISGSRFIELPKTGHAIPQTRPFALIDAIGWVLE